MEAIAQPELAQDPEPRFVVFAGGQSEHLPLPALMYADGKIMTVIRLIVGLIVLIYSLQLFGISL